jgi:lipopolysaccharide transport protein LptA
MRIFNLFIPTAAVFMTGITCFAQYDGAVPKSKGGAGSTLFSPMAGDRPEGAKTEITAKEEATYDPDANVAEFKGMVVVKDPQFTLTCDQLVVSLGKNGEGIEKADAIGNVVIIQELPPEKKETPKAIGRAGSVTYKPEIGEIEMRDFPSIQQGINYQVATEASTVMLLRNNGQSRTFGGGSKTLIVSETSQTP